VLGSTFASSLGFVSFSFFSSSSAARVSALVLLGLFVPEYSSNGVRAWRGIEFCLDRADARGPCASAVSFSSFVSSFFSVCVLRLRHHARVRRPVLLALSANAETTHNTANTLHAKSSSFSYLQFAPHCSIVYALCCNRSGGKLELKGGGNCIFFVFDTSTKRMWKLKHTVSIHNLNTR
jgi:hypothetical protein